MLPISNHTNLISAQLLILVPPLTTFRRDADNRLLGLGLWHKLGTNPIHGAQELAEHTTRAQMAGL